MSLTLDGNDLNIAYTPGQVEIFFTYPERFICVPKGRRFGITHGAANYCIEMLIEGKKILWIDTVQTNCDKYYRRYFEPLIKNIDPMYYAYRQSKDLRICNGLLDFRSAEKPQNIEGFAYDIIIINESGIVLQGQRGRNLWYNSVYPMVLDYKAEVYFLGTPKGKRAKKEESPAKNCLYYELCLKGGLEDPEHNTSYRALLEKQRLEDPKAYEDALKHLHRKEDNWKTLTFTSYDNPLLDPLEIEELEDDIPRVTKAQEIRGKFIDVGDEEVFHEEWFNVVYELPKESTWGRKIISLDTAFKKGAENDDSAGICVLETNVGYFIVDMFLDKLEFPQLVKKATEFYMRQERQSPVSRFLIEDKASGTPLIQTFKQEVNFPITPITPINDKYTRAVAITPFFEGGQVFLLFGWWNDIYRNYMCDFNAKLDTPDDLIDATSQFFNYIKSNASPNTPGTTRKRRKITKILEGYA